MKVKMKRHESFSIREGWLAKGLKAVKDNDKIFISPEATDILGIGTNMVKSLKYWMLASKLIIVKNRTVSLSDFGELLYKYDKYLEDKFSWWLIHIMMILNENDAYIFNIFFNKCTSKNFSKRDIYEQISNILDSQNGEYSEKILQDEINMIIKTYSIDEKIDNPENNFICPLSDLNLIRKEDKDWYEKNKPEYKDLNYLIVYYLITIIMGNKESISINDLVFIENSPIKILNLDKNLLNEYLDEMKRNNLIIINRTAGLNMVYLRKKMTLEEIIKEYYD